jgi:hypothetical protein
VLVRQKSSVEDFYDEDEVRNVYYPEAERLIKAATGADRVFVFDHTVRKRVQGAADRDGGLRQPAARVDVDHTEKSGLQRVRDLVPDEAEELLKGRVQIINLGLAGMPMGYAVAPKGLPLPSNAMALAPRTASTGSR